MTTTQTKPTYTAQPLGIEQALAQLIRDLAAMKK
ncbi:hypothetical protein RHODGE_RHODGE_00995 [Rhodoplanes serenus]|uniref:Uncharacterized protein n=1 Tax=Rhodoplanes serenus TaxID=200615 RepID=A0A3S4BCT1_9BRAD|nr:hypothetical protein RHODPL_RHODPL_00064 [Rhodoplanes serenus]VCU07845.1 hypothetical protein RHODGE_RHODGE_00995 [Rhodoplanes serenus]